MLRRASFLSSLATCAVFVWCGDRFWNLSSTGVFPAPTRNECIRTTLADIAQGDSVWARTFSSDTARYQTTYFGGLFHVPLGQLAVVEERGEDSVRVNLLYSWTGPKPNRDTVQARARLFSQFIDRVGTNCWGGVVPIKTDWPQ